MYSPIPIFNTLFINTILSHNCTVQSPYLPQFSLTPFYRKTVQSGPHIYHTFPKAHPIAHMYSPIPIFTTIFLNTILSHNCTVQSPYLAQFSLTSFYRTTVKLDPHIYYTFPKAHSIAHIYSPIPIFTTLFPNPILSHNCTVRSPYLPHFSQRTLHCTYVKSDPHIYHTYP
jgi:hypothetical protein